MTHKKNSIRDRDHKKFTPQKGVFAVLTSDVSRLGPVKEISRSGLSFHCLDSGKPAKSSDEVEIFSTAHDFYLKKLPVRTVAESKVIDTTESHSLPVRELNIQFGKMTPVQLRLLDFFLRHFTLD